MEERMHNINIKTIFIEKNLADENIIKNFEKAGAEVIPVNVCEFEECNKASKTPLFNRAAIGGAELSAAAKAAGVRTVSANREALANADVKNFLECGRLQPYETDETGFIETDIEAEDTGHLESVFALGNGYLGLRGTYDERDDKIPETPGMYINEIFETEPIVHPWPCKGFAKNEEYTVNLCDWRITELFADGEKICFSNGIKNHRRRLDFRRGEIVRSFDVLLKRGKTLHVESIRLVSLSRVHGAALKYTVSSLDFDGELEIRSSVVKNTPINGKITTKTVNEKAEGKAFLLETRTKRTCMDVAAAVLHTVIAAEYTDEVINSENTYTYTIRAALKPGNAVSLEKYASFYSAADGADNLAESAMRGAEKNAADGFGTLRSEQAAAWANHWKTGDILIKGSKADQQAVRFSLFHLRSQLPTVNNASIGATGLTGPNYSGKVFWDTEMYLMPYYLFTEPEHCKGLILYRIKLLDKARKRAEEIGNEGALYSWCSIDGEETSVVFEASTAEYHINADIAYAVWRYEKVTGDSGFVYEYCSEMLFETARFYAHRGSFVEAHDGRFCINSVCGPDEYACGVNNNCYTNFMVQQHLRYALKIYGDMQKHAPEKLAEVAEKISLHEKELKLWRDAADKMYYRVNERYGIYEQDDRFVYNDAVDMDTIPKNFDIRHLYHPLDLWRIQVLKQADVVLLQFIQGNRFTLEEKRHNYDYYEPKTNHGSSLSAAIHSIMANEIGYTKDAYEYFRSAAYMDIGDFKKNTSGGIHIACHGGVWMSVVNGFMGMRLYDEGLFFSPKLPEEWERCEFNLAYNNAVVKICAERFETTFTLVKGEKFEFTVCGKAVTLDAEHGKYVLTTCEKGSTAKTEAVIFDLDGVIVSTDDCHYRAWKKMADEEGIHFDREINRRLRGVSRMASLDIVLEKADREYSESEKQALAERKNNYYRELITRLTPGDILPGVTEKLKMLKEHGIKIAIGSSSKNTPVILKQIGLDNFFDAVSDGNNITHSKPDPEVFLKAAEMLGIAPERCMIVEDADAGIEAGRRAGMKTLSLQGAKGADFESKNLACCDLLSLI